MKAKLLALLSFFFPLANNVTPEKMDYRRYMSSMTPDSARASLYMEEV